LVFQRQEEGCFQDAIVYCLGNTTFKEDLPSILSALCHGNKKDLLVDYSFGVFVNEVQANFSLERSSTMVSSYNEVNTLAMSFAPSGRRGSTIVIIVIHN
jgi:hypothetical protein